MSGFVETPWGFVNEQVATPMLRETVTYAEPHTVITKEQHQANVDALMEEFKTTLKYKVAKELMVRIPEAFAPKINFRSYTDWNGVLKVDCNLTLNDSEDVFNVIDIKQEYTGSRYWSKPTGKFNISLGNYGNKTLFKQLKDGEFKWDKMASILISMVETKRTLNKQRDVRDINQKVVDELDKELGTRYSSTFKLTATSVNAPVTVQFTCNMMTAEEVKYLHALLEKEGFLK